MERKPRPHLEQSPTSLVGFVVGPSRYAIEVSRVREIVRPEPVSLVSSAPSALLGVAHHRGEIVSVVDVRCRLGFGPRAAGAPSRWLMVRMRSGRTAALVVDEVTEVMSASPADARSLPPLGPGIADAVAAVYVHENQLVFALDVEKLARPVLDLAVEGEPR